MIILKKGSFEKTHRIRATCKFCKTKVKLSKDDYITGYGDSFIWTCPICNKKNYKVTLLNKLKPLFTKNELLIIIRGIFLAILLIIFIYGICWLGCV